MLPIQNLICEQYIRRGSFLASIFIRRSLNPTASIVHIKRGKRDTKNYDDTSNINSFIRPVPVKSNPDDINIGSELTGDLNKTNLLLILNKFIEMKEIKSLAQDYGLDNYLQKKAFIEFREYCVRSQSLPTDLHIVLSDILQNAANVTDLFPYFLRFAKKLFPHIECLDDLKKISDLRSPANWYPAARAKTRKIIFHAGPTNSGKTYHALERFIRAKSGVYCGPLKLLVSEVYNKCNKMGTPCDLVTGEERRYAHSPDNPADHVSCSVEMVNLNNSYEVAVIDEIQLLRDPGRGWAWTRALLGIPADEIHLCGETAAIDLVKSICLTTGETPEIRKYKRLTQLVVENSPLGSLKNIRPSDCIVCFSKNDIFAVTRQLETEGIETAVIYGSLPPGTKLAQAAKFNDPNNPCKVLVATNAIGMGLNLHIRRIIFYSLIQPTVNEKGEKEMDTISVSTALQISGRAGRYGTQWNTGYVTTYKAHDLPTLKHLLSQQPEPITQAGLHPTSDQIELYAYHLPETTLSNLLDIFIKLSTIDDSLYFICNTDDFKFLADMIQHVPLPLRARYVFCCAPINRKLPFSCAMFLKFARQYSKNDKITFNWLCNHIGWPFSTPKTILDLVHLEAVFDIMDVYLWLSYRFPDLFPDTNIVRDVQQELDSFIQKGVLHMKELINTSMDGGNSGEPSEPDEFYVQTRKHNFYKGNNESSKRKVSVPIRKGKLTERLLAEGLLTPQMLQELQNEWSKKKK
ncbi:PREDICTED: ATP-dependent RNA helicase SUV3 homolog, mitochondrial [Polistes dominula]|uniref:RNA helicase n=1 Tax=Polistes dominula TaxID=743375 RepID=A0ABM1J0V8_POLDO|nr:PREDICTED: ATP-dependent RNA helicase SUV3 homolog, mitochondrial [Polistes dominula]XP_015186096.1 PREDICTED: ATP-dependent RNA helicase SUV3 homolog, mitochondrial [Polistes dominula]